MMIVLVLPSPPSDLFDGVVVLEEDCADVVAAPLVETGTRDVDVAVWSAVETLTSVTNDPAGNVKTFCLAAQFPL